MVFYGPPDAGLRRPRAEHSGEGDEDVVTWKSPRVITVAYRSAVDAEEVADALYALPPEQFTAARNARAQAAKAAGDREAAARIAALRKPTVLGWLVNLLVRELPDEIGGFLDLGDALRERPRR